MGDAAEAATLDLRGLKCPLPALKARRRLADLSAGDRLLVEATDPLSVIDIPHMCRENRHRLISCETRDDVHSFLIERGT